MCRDLIVLRCSRVVHSLGSYGLPYGSVEDGITVRHGILVRIFYSKKMCEWNVTLTYGSFLRSVCVEPVRARRGSVYTRSIFYAA